MHRNLSTPSLIQNLKTDRETGTDANGKIRLIVASYPDDVVGKNSSYPFLIVSENDPVTNLLEGGVFSDAGFSIKRVFLLIQKDEYFVRKDDLWPVINEDIDRLWQRAFKTRRGPGPPGLSPVFFEEQFGKDERLLPYRPVFLCRHTQRFFHPPCPECGRSLALCEDDRLLKKNGLEAYSESLSRYLHCEKCASKSNNPDFYVKSLRNRDPSILKDANDLIAGFRGLVEKNADSGLPCTSCEYFADCFAEGGPARDRIVVFSFFPFYMMVVEAPSLHSQDFISMLSGAPAEEVLANLEKTGEYGRRRLLESLSTASRRFIFENDKRLFYEILYLKLSFLGEFAKALFKNINVRKYPDSSLSLDGIWVKLHQENSMLPAFWNFSLQSIDIGGAAPQLAFIPRLPPFFSLYGLSVIWFCTLLANKKQGVVAIRRKVSDEMERLVSKEIDTFEDLLEERVESEWGPENVFWSPDTMAQFLPDSESENEKYPKEAVSIWKEALSIGWSLLKSSMVGDSNWSEEDFHGRLDALREKIRWQLFAPAPSAQARDVAVSADSADRDLAVSRVLEQIAEKWKGRLEPAEERREEEDSFELEAYDDEPELELEEDDEDETDTVILSPDQLPVDQFDVPDTGDEGAAGPVDDGEEDTPETVILSQDDVPAYARKADDIEKLEDPYTYEERTDFDIGMELEKEDDDESEEDTVILSPEQMEKQGDWGDYDDGKSEAGKTDDEFEIVGEDDDDDDDDDEELLQTVMLTPESEKNAGHDDESREDDADFYGKEAGRDADEEPEEDDDDFLSETVFLSTGKFTLDSDIAKSSEPEEKKKDEPDEKPEKRMGEDDDDDDDDDELMQTIILDPEDKK